MNNCSYRSHITTCTRPFRAFSYCTSLAGRKTSFPASAHIQCIDIGAHHLPCIPWQCTYCKFWYCWQPNGDVVATCGKRRICVSSLCGADVKLLRRLEPRWQRTHLTTWAPSTSHNMGPEHVPRQYPPVPTSTHQSRCHLSPTYGDISKLGNVIMVNGRHGAKPCCF